MQLVKISQNMSYLRYLTYSECSSVICFGYLGTRKLSFPPYFYLLNNKNIVRLYKTVFATNHFAMPLLKYADTLIRILFSSMGNGAFLGFRLIGRGYKVYYHLNSFLFRLGYSHNIYYNLPIYLRSNKKEKNKHFWLLKGTSIRDITSSLDVIKNFRLPDVYRIKGIYKQGDIYRVKSSKKGVL